MSREIHYDEAKQIMNTEIQDITKLEVCMNKRILVIEPSHSIRVILDITLRNAGHQVATFEDATAAFAFLSPELVHKEPPDIAFVALPSSAEKNAKESYAALATLMGQYPQLRTIALLPLHANQKEQRPLQENGVMYLIRPFTVQDILACTTLAYGQPPKGNTTR